MDFVKYPHLERFGTDEVDGINVGECHIFPKIDGTNASFWWDGEKLACGSRNRRLSVDEDNAGFMNWAITQPHVVEFARQFPLLVVYGEWLVPLPSAFTPAHNCSIGPLLPCSGMRCDRSPFWAAEVACWVCSTASGPHTSASNRRWVTTCPAQRTSRAKSSNSVGVR